MKTARLLRRILIIFGVVLIFLACLFCYTIFPPDIWRGSIWLAYERMDNGCEFMLRQYWGCDLYTTQVIIVHPAKGYTYLVLSPDDIKWWIGKIESDPEHGKVYIYNGDTLVSVLDLEKEMNYLPEREHYPNQPWEWHHYKTNAWGKYFL